MTDDERKQLAELHAFFMAPRAPGKPSRAAEIDDALAGVRAGKIGYRFTLYVTGFITAVFAAWTAIKGGWN